VVLCLIDSCASTVCLTFNHRADPDSTNPGQLLDHLLSDVASTADMQDMLGLLQDSLPSLEGGAPEGDPGLCTALTLSCATFAAWVLSTVQYCILWIGG
jgi:hypothetical protein